MANDTKFAFLPSNKGVGDLQSKTVIELKEMLDRQNHLLANKLVINKLKDKGEKIKKAYDEIENELKLRQTLTNSLKSNNSSTLEWQNTPKNKEDPITADVIEKEEKDVLKILSENGQVPNKTKDEYHKSYVERLIEKEKDPNFSFKPYNSVVSEKIKKIIPNAHTEVKPSTSVKSIHLEESLNLLTEQMSSLKILGSNVRRKRVDECIEDRMNDCSYEQIEERENEILDDNEEKGSITVNVNVSN